MKKFMGLCVFIILIAGISQESLASVTKHDSNVCSFADSETEVEIEYLSPFDKDRQIETVSLNLFKEDKQIGRNWITYNGITLTRPWGSINRATINPDSSAFGIGPVFLIRYEFYQQPKVTLVWDSSVGLIFYSDRFPAGGDVYNFMWRIGPGIKYKLTDQNSLSMSFKLMHVSNGQISHHDPTRNPSYNAVGYSITYNVMF